MPGARWFEGARAQLRGEPARRPAGRAAGDPGRIGAARALRAHHGRAPLTGRPGRRGDARARRRAGRPGRRVHAEHPRGDRRLPRDGVDRRDLVELLARLRRQLDVVDRFAQIEPKLLFCVDGYRYNGRDFDRRDVVAGLLAEMPTVEHAVVLGYLDPEPDIAACVARSPGTTCSTRRRRPSSRSSRCPSTTRSGSSTRPGTTGLPKAIVQGHGGILLEQLKHHHLHLDAQAGDRDLLVHDDRLDDVELPRRRPAHGRLDRALRRQPGPSRHGRALGPRRRAPASPASAPAPATSPRA